MNYGKNFIKYIHLKIMEIKYNDCIYFLYMKSFDKFFDFIFLCASDIHERMI